MRLEWDEDKCAINLAKHGLDFVDASRIFRAPFFVELDDREDYGEDRWIGAGMLDERIVVMVFTMPEEEVVRVISLRKALSHERKAYEQEFKDRLGAG